MPSHAPDGGGHSFPVEAQGSGLMPRCFVDDPWMTGSMLRRLQLMASLLSGPRKVRWGSLSRRSVHGAVVGSYWIVVGCMVHHPTVIVNACLKANSDARSGVSF